MRILIISNIFPPEFIGGYELVAADLARRLAADGHDVTVLTSHMIGETPDVFWPFQVHRTLQCLTATPDIIQDEDKRVRGGIVNITNLKTIARTMASLLPSAVLCCNLAGLGPFGILKFLTELGVRPVLYLGDNIFGNGLRDGTERRRFLEFIDAQQVLSRVSVLAVSKVILAEVSDWLGFTLTSVLNVPGWVDPTIAPVVPRTQQAASPVTQFVFSSRIAPHKGIHLVLDAAALMLARGERRFTVDLFGAGEVAFTLQRARLLGLEGVVRYCGNTSKKEMIDRFAAYDALLFPTWEREPFGFVAAEAAYQGCTPIMTSTCGAAEWFIDGIDCIKIERSVTGLADAMLAYCHLSAYGRRRLAQNTMQTGRAMFRFEPWFKKIVQTIEASVTESTLVDLGAVLNALTLQFRLIL